MKCIVTLLFFFIFTLLVFFILTYFFFFALRSCHTGFSVGYFPSRLTVSTPGSEAIAWHPHSILASFKVRDFVVKLILQFFIFVFNDPKFLDMLVENTPDRLLFLKFLPLIQNVSFELYIHRI